MSSDANEVLVLGLNYPPERTGISPYTGSMARGLARRGFITRVLTTHPHYPDWRVRPGYGGWSRRERLDGVDVTRLMHYVPRLPKGLKRLASEASFGARVATRTWGHPDVIVAVSPALISSAIGAIRARLTHRKTPFVVWVQDLYTLGLAETGQAKGAIVSAMAMFEGWLLRRADRVVVIHDRFAARVANDFNVSKERISVIRNWTHLPPATDIDVEETRAKLGWGRETIVVLHAGNMGIKQGLHHVIEAARLAEQRAEHIRFVLVGGGSQRQQLEAAGQGVSTLQFLPSLNDADFAAALGSADALLVNELPGVAEMAVPSKLTSYFSAARPVVAATDPSGITAEEIRAANAGVVVPAGDASALLDAALELGSDHDRARELGLNGRAYRESVLDEEHAINKFTEVLTTLVRHDESSPVGASTR